MTMEGVGRWSVLADPQGAVSSRCSNRWNAVNDRALSCWRRWPHSAAAFAQTPAELLTQPAIRAAFDAAPAQRAGDDRPAGQALRDPRAALSRGGARQRAASACSSSSACKDVRIDRGRQRDRRAARQGGAPESGVQPRTSTPSSPKAPTSKSRAKASILKGPGIGDDCRGLAVMLAVIRALNEAQRRDSRHDHVRRRRRRGGAGRPARHEAAVLRQPQGPDR